MDSRTEIIEHVKHTVREPVYSDYSIGDCWLWSIANHAELTRYWNDLGKAMGLTDTNSDEFELFCKCQHELALTRAVQ